MADGVDEKTYSAKQVATRIGTDAKQLRKFFRDPNSGYTPVGQGGRYDFPESEIPKIRDAFVAWDSTKTRRNRSSNPQKKLAQSAGLIPGQRKESPGTDTPPRPRRQSATALAKEGLHGNALDEDTLEDRMKGIAARVKKHNLVPKGGRLVPGPRKVKPAEAVPSYPDLDTVPGMDKPEAKWLDFGDPSDEELEKLDDLFEPADEEGKDYDLELELGED